MTLALLHKSNEKCLLPFLGAGEGEGHSRIEGFLAAVVLIRHLGREGIGRFDDPNGFAITFPQRVDVGEQRLEFAVPIGVIGHPDDIEGNRIHVTKAIALDEDGKLTTVPLGLHYQQDTVTYDWTVTYYEDGDAEFSINEEGKLLWKDLKEDAAKDLAFEKIGSFYGTRWMKDDIEVIFFDWYDEQYDIRLYQRGEGGEILKDAILKGDYDADTDTLTATGEFDNEEPFTVTFSYDESNHIVWTENGESTVLEYSTLED